MVQDKILLVLSKRFHKFCNSQGIMRFQNMILNVNMLNMLFYVNLHVNVTIHCRQLLIGHLTFFTLVQKVKLGHKKFLLL